MKEVLDLLMSLSRAKMEVKVDPDAAAAVRRPGPARRQPEVPSP